MITLRIKYRRSGPVFNRHPWVFSRAIENLPDGMQPGAPVRMLDEKGHFLACGYFNSYSQIAVRIWGYEEQESVDRVFFLKRILRAHQIRKKYVERPDTDSYRLINGENDFLPGLIADKYGEYLVVQFHTRGIEYWKDTIVSALTEALAPRGIYERSDVYSREIEGPHTGSRLLYGDLPDLVEIQENGFRFLADLKRGQKTGFFFDQRDKRHALLKYSHSRSALNCFSYTGAFSVYALAGGAQRVVNVDTSSYALQLARENTKLNNLDIGRCEFICEDAKTYLKKARSGEFDLVILDPPAFVKDRKKKNEGVAGYRGINEASLRILPEDGILVTCSCSAHVSGQDFRYLLVEAGGRAGRSLRFLETYTHGIDHPELAPFTEGGYLKCFFIAV